MARKVVVLAILLLAVAQVYVAVADDNNSPPSPSYDSDDDLAEPPTDGVIGTLDDDIDADSPAAVLVAPMGGPVPPGAFDTVSGSSGASSVGFSTVAGAVALAAGAMYL